MTELVLTPDDAALLLRRRGHFRLYAELNHKAKMRAARMEQKKLADELLSMGIHPAWVLFEFQLERQSATEN